VPILIKTVVYASGYSRDLFIEWGITLCFILQKYNVSVLQDSSGPGWGPAVDYYERSNKHSDSIKDSKFLDHESGSF